MSTTFQMETPRPVPGIYRLQRQNGQFYIGATMNLKVRHQEWRAVFTSGLGHKNLHLRDAMTDPAEWEMHILEYLPDPKQLHAREALVIREFASDLMLNSVRPAGRTGQCAPGITITHNGATLGTREAAEMLGCSPTTLRRRLRDYRSKGMMDIEFTTLKVQTDKWRKGQGLNVTVSDP